MQDPVAEYLRLLKKALQAEGVVELYDALDDAREFLGSELWSCRRARPELDEEQAFERVVTKFGTPEEIAHAYKESEGHGSPFVELVHRLRRFSYAPGWKLSCRRCGRTGDLEAGSPFSLRIGARSLSKLTLGWCTGCQRPRILRHHRLA